MFLTLGLEPGGRSTRPTRGPARSRSGSAASVRASPSDRPHGALTDRDLELCNLTYGLVARLGRVPLAQEAANAAGVSRDELVGSWRRLHDAHALVLDGDRRVRMANPFSGRADRRTASRQTAGRGTRLRVGRVRHLRCCKSDGRIETSCPDCGEPIVVEVRDRRPDDKTLLFHCLVPAARWWDDIVVT